MPDDVTPKTLLDDIIATTGEEPSSQFVDFTGTGHFYPTPFRVGEYGAAAVAASAVGAMRLWEMKTGRTQQISVDIDAAGEAMRGHKHMVKERPDGTREPERASPPGRRMFKTKDGHWIYFRSGFKHHAEAVAQVLGCNYKDEELIPAVAKWDALELEEHVTAAGGSAGVVRSYDEWANHPQGMAVAGLPLFEVIKIGESDPEPMPNGDRPLSGIRALDLTRVLAGPTCTRTLAEHGAEVLRIDFLRLPDGEGYVDTGHGKRSTAIDLANPGGVEKLKELVKDADVFSQGYRPGSLAAKGFSPEELAKIRPGIICCSISAFSHEGPWRNKRGFGTIIASVSGIADESAVDGEPRTLLDRELGGSSIEDFATGYIAAYGVMVALARRAREGGSYLVRASIAQTAKKLADSSRYGSDVALGEPLSPESLESFMMSSETAGGKIWHMAPVAQMSETHPHWSRATVPPNFDPPEWLGAQAIAH